MALTLTRTAWTDDDGSGTTGTVINNAEKTALYDQIDAALAKLVTPMHSGITSVANGTTVETDLATYSLTAATLGTNGAAVRIRAFGQGAANTNTKTLKIYFGATVVTTVAFATATYLAWEITAEVKRTAAATQIAIGVANVHLYGGLSVTYTTPAETLANAITIKVTGQSSAASNDLTLKSFSVDYVPAP